MIDLPIEKMGSNKPYIVKAYYDWISDHDLTPYIVVDVNVVGVLVPMSYVVDGQIVLNIAATAVGTIALGSQFIEFSARFGGKLENITVPYGAIAAIYAKENGAGTSLAIEDSSADELEARVKDDTKVKPSLSSVSVSQKPTESTLNPTEKVKGKANLKIIK